MTDPHYKRESEEIAEARKLPHCHACDIRLRTFAAGFVCGRGDDRCPVPPEVRVAPLVNSDGRPDDAEPTVRIEDHIVDAVNGYLSQRRRNFWSADAGATLEIKSQ